MDIKEMRKLLSITQEQFSNNYNIPLPTLRHWERGDRTCPVYVLELLEFKVKEELKMKCKTVGYFMETGIFFQGKEQPPRKTPLIMIGDKPSFNLNDYSDNDDIPVLSIDGNWYTIKKSEIIMN